jgi:hypothetical protein
MSTMAIFKATYTRSSAGAKAAIRYMQHRSGKEGAKITRTLFGWDGVMERREAYGMIDEAEQGSLFFRFVVSPDPKAEDTKKDLFLRDIIQQTMLKLEDQPHKPVEWVAVEHNDHTSIRHVHVLAIAQRRLQVQDLQSLRHVATDAAVEQRRQLDLAYGEQAKAQEGRVGEEAAWEHAV